MWLCAQTGASPATIRRTTKSQRHPFKKADSLGDNSLQGLKLTGSKSSDKAPEAEEKRQSPRPIGFRTSIIENTDKVLLFNVLILVQCSKWFNR